MSTAITAKDIADYLYFVWSNGQSLTGAAGTVHALAGGNAQLIAQAETEFNSRIPDQYRVSVGNAINALRS